MTKVNLLEKFGLFTEQWSPKVVGALNGQEVKLVKIDGEFIWHAHDAEDELFLVVKGRFDMHYRNRIETISEGEFIIVPHGVEHKPVATGEAWILLFEPAATVNTGNVASGRTRTPEQL
jgi:mannose-6-phosphate isomerase-like protein (cupin superfamily)